MHPSFFLFLDADSKMATSSVSEEDRILFLTRMHLDKEHYQNADELLDKSVKGMREYILGEADNAAGTTISRTEAQKLWVSHDIALAHHPALSRKNPPSLQEIPLELRSSTNSDSKVKKAMVEEMWSKGATELYTHLCGGEAVVEAMQSVECDCDGDCAIQRAKVSTIETSPSFHQAGIIEPIPFVPCVSERTKNLPLYRAEKVSFVSTPFRFSCVDYS